MAGGSFGAVPIAPEAGGEGLLLVGRRAAQAPPAT